MSICGTIISRGVPDKTVKLFSIGERFITSDNQYFSNFFRTYTYQQLVGLIGKTFLALQSGEDEDAAIAIAVYSALLSQMVDGDALQFKYSS